MPVRLTPMPPHPLGLLRARRGRPRRSRAAEQRDELASFQLIELHSVACQPGAGLQDIEVAEDQLGGIGCFI
jgi:hypothetical protein